MKPVRSLVTITIILALTMVTSSTRAADYHDMKSRAREGKSGIYDSILIVYENVPTRAHEKAYELDFSNLESGFRADSSRDPLTGILELYPEIDRSMIERFVYLDEESILNRISNGLSEQEIVSLVIARSNRISKERESWQASLNLYPQTVYLQDLLNTFQPFTEGMSLGVGKEYQREMIRMYHPLPGMLSLRGKAVAIDIETAWLEYLRESRDVISDTKTILAEIRNRDELISINSESAHLLRVLRDVAEAQYKTGTRSFADLIRLETELVKRLDKVEQLSSMRSGMVSKLLGMLDLPADAGFGEIIWSKDKLIDLDKIDLQENLHDTRQELKQIALKLEKMDVMIDMTQLRAVPDLTQGFTYFQGRDVQTINKNKNMETGMDGMSDMSPNGKMDMSSMNFMQKPMLDYRQSNTFTDLAWAMELIDRRDAMNEMLQAKTNMAYGMLEMLVKRLNQVKESETVYSRKIIPDANAALEVVRKGYSADENSFNDLVVSEMSLLMARMELANLNLERRLSLIELERLIGKEIQDHG